MSGHHNFSELRARMSKERRERNESAASDMHKEYVLSQIRREVGFTQAEVARKLEISQPSYAECEKGGNMRIGTLQKIVAALGGVLKFEVELDGRDYPLQLSQRYAIA